MPAALEGIDWSKVERIDDSTIEGGDYICSLNLELGLGGESTADEWLDKRLSLMAARNSTPQKD